jgi:putative ABC transport system permease protein
VAQVEPAGAEVDLLGVDPRTFADAAFWDGSFASASLSNLLDGLSTRPRGRIPAVAVRIGLGAQAEIGIASYRLPIELVGTAQGFPGMVGMRPLIVVPSDLLRQSLERQGTSIGAVLGTEELWARGGAGNVLAGLRRAGLPAESIQVAERVAATPAFLALSWTFGFLEALGVLAGSIVLAGLLLYLQARQRDREVSYALARRMGLDRRAHRQAVAIEIAVMLLTSFVVATVLGIGASWLVHGRLDLLPSLPPAPLLRIPASLFLVALGVVALLGVVGAWEVQRHADRANVGELMRAAG